MALNVNLGTVQKPEYTKIVSTDGAKTIISFEPGVILPFDDVSVKEYLDKGTRMNLPAWNNLVVAVLRETVPEFVGTNGFYNLERTRLNPEVEVFNSDEKKSLDYGHFEGDVFTAWSRISTHSPTGYYPVQDGENNTSLPTIDRVEVESYVHVPINIPIPGKEDQIYVKGISVPIAQALLSGKPIKLRVEDNRLREGIYFASPVAFVQVANPTVEQMKRAIAEAKTVRYFFDERSDELQNIAGVVAEAWHIDRESKAIILSAHKELEKVYGRARTERCPEVPESPSSSAAIGYIDNKINDLLGTANEQLASLRSGFKSKLFDYTTQAETKDTMSRRFHF